MDTAMSPLVLRGPTKKLPAFALLDLRGFQLSQQSDNRDCDLCLINKKKNFTQAVTSFIMFDEKSPS